MSNQQYAPETPIEFYLSTGYVGCSERETRTVAEWLGDDLDYHALSDSDVEDLLNEAFNVWMWNSIDAGWGLTA